MQAIEDFLAGWAAAGGGPSGEKVLDGLHA